MASKGERTRELILKNTLKLVGEKGFANASIQMVADRSRISQGAVMQHFPSKARLFEAVRKYVTRHNHQYVDSKVSPLDSGVEALVKHMKANIEWALRNRAEANVWLLVYEAGFRDPEYRSICRDAVRYGEERIRRFILAAQRESEVPKALNSIHAAAAAQEYILGLATKILATSTSKKMSKAQVARLETFVAGFRKS